MPSVRETDPDKTVTVERPPASEPAKPAAETPAPQPSFDDQYKARLKQDFGVDDPAEITRSRERAGQADEYERQLQVYQRQIPPHVTPQRPQPQPQQFDMEQWMALARINPGLAQLQREQFLGQQRQHEQMQQMAFVEARIRAAHEFTATEAAAERYVREEFPEAYNASSKLHKAGKAVYNAMPWLHNMGNGFQIATQIAAAEQGMLPKSKRQPTVTPDEVADQAPERGTRRPAADDKDDDKRPLTPRQKKMVKDLGVDEKTYRKFRAARETGKNVTVK